MFSTLLILGNVATVIALSGVNNRTGLNLDCTNDLNKWMSCHFEAQNCPEYSLTLESNDGYGVEHCIFKQCDSGQCCCFVQMILVLRESHTATVWKGGNRMESKVINITDSIKPNTPTIVSVKESYRNFQIRWKTNMNDNFSDRPTANVTYRKKGEIQKVSKTVHPTTVDGLNYYEILGQHLESKTTYLVSVTTYTDWSGRFSDSSEEWEFTTPMSPKALILPTIISLSIAAVIISSAIYGCYVKFKTKWWDTVAKCQNPKLLVMHQSEQEILKPIPPLISSIYVEPFVLDDSKPWSKMLMSGSPQQSSWSPQLSSGISTGSSCLSYANTEPHKIIAEVQDALVKAFPNISPISPMTTNPFTELNKDSDLVSASYNPCVRAEDMSSGSSSFDNRTYSIVVPSCPQEIATGSSEAQVEMLCDSAYHPSEGGIVISPDQQAPTCPLVNLSPLVSSLMPTDMSYQPCNADSERLSHAEDSSLSSISSGANVIASCDPGPRVEVGYESLDEVACNATMLNGKTEEATVCDENPCYGCVPARSNSFPAVDDDYQAFQNLVEQPVILFSENKSVEKEEHLNKHPEESFIKTPQNFLSPVVPGFISNVQGRQCLSELQKPFPPLISADQSMPVITDNGYQSV